ncbi:Cobalt-precorrin-2 C20-methyltransferase [Mycobacterium marinum MB2]|nr:Cobalt-precorrin-2 C20-methyltransferase [Mycobacterium marinum MB2]
MSQRGADPTGHGLGRRHRGNDPNRHPGPLFGLLEHGSGHCEHARVARRHHRHRAPLLGQRAGQPGSGGFVGVVAGMTPLAVTDRNPVQVGAIADQVGRPCQLPAALWRHPVRVAGAQSDHGNGAGDHRAPTAARQHGQRKIGHAGFVDVGGWQHALPRRAGSLHVERVIELAASRKCFADIVIRTSQLEHHGRVDVGEATGQLGNRQGAGQHRQHLVAGHQRGGDGRGGGAHRGHPRHDDGVEPLGQPGVQVHV